MFPEMTYKVEWDVKPLLTHVLICIVICFNYVYRSFLNGVVFNMIEYFRWINLECSLVSLLP